MYAEDVAEIVEEVKRRGVPLPRYQGQEPAQERRSDGA
jgi:hypothetical protein